MESRVHLSECKVCTCNLHTTVRTVQRNRAQVAADLGGTWETMSGHGYFTYQVKPTTQGGLHQ